MTIKNFIFKSINGRSLFDDCESVISSATSFNQGDFLYYNRATSLLHSQTTGDTGANFCGQAQQTVVSGNIQLPYSTDVDASAVNSHVQGPWYGDIVLATPKTGDAFAAGCKVYPDPATGTRGVSSTSGSLTAIGIYQGDTLASAASGTNIPVLLGETYSGSLTF
jgi:hypothetical protein